MQMNIAPEYVDVVFIRHAECMHTAAVGMPSAIMVQFTSTDEAVRASVEPLVTRFDTPVRVQQGQWKACAKETPFAVLTQADTPLLPSELADEAHLPRLRATLTTLAQHTFICAAPPLLRMKASVAIAKAVAQQLEGASAAAASLGKCNVTATLLPRPSPLHAREDVAALTAAAQAALAAAEMGEVGALARSVLGAVEDVAIATRLLRACVAYLESYSQLDSDGGFVNDEVADAAVAALPEGTSASAKFATWAFAAATRRGCRTVVVFGGTGWWASLINQLGGAALPAAIRDRVLPEIAISQDAKDANGEPIQLPLMPPAAGARYVRIERTADGFALALSDASLAALNPSAPPTGAESGAQRDAWLRGLLATGEACSY